MIQSQTETPSFAMETRPHIEIPKYETSSTDEPKKKNWPKLICYWVLLLGLSFVFWVGIVTIGETVQQWLRHEGII